MPLFLIVSRLIVTIKDDKLLFAKVWQIDNSRISRDRETEINIDFDNRVCKARSFILILIIALSVQCLSVHLSYLWFE